jgi:hypothetical protein
MDIYIYMCVCVCVCVCVRVRAFINGSLIGYIIQWDFQAKKYVHSEPIVQNTAIENILLCFVFVTSGFKSRPWCLLFCEVASPFAVLCSG